MINVCNAVGTVSRLGFAIRTIRNKIFGYRVVPVVRFETSEQYWDERYSLGGDSGAGSYNRLARFKADVINRIVMERHISSVIEFGCGDGAQLTLAKYQTYLGVDVSRNAISQISARFSHYSSFSFMHASEWKSNITADLALSLDVIYHLIEDDIFHKYMCDLFGSSNRYVLIYSSNDDALTSAAHVRHRRFSRWIEINRGDFSLVTRIRNRYPFNIKNPAHTSFADFWLFKKQSI